MAVGSMLQGMWRSLGANVSAGLLLTIAASTRTFPLVYTPHRCANAHHAAVPALHPAGASHLGCPVAPRESQTVSRLLDLLIRGACRCPFFSLDRGACLLSSTSPAYQTTQTTMALPGWMKGVVKEVPSGDQVVVAAPGAKGLPGPEKRITLSSVLAPRMVRVGARAMGHWQAHAPAALFRRYRSGPRRPLQRSVSTMPAAEGAGSARSSDECVPCSADTPPPNRRHLCCPPLCCCRAAVTAARVTSPLPGRLASTCASSAWARWAGRPGPCMLPGGAASRACPLGPCTVGWGGCWLAHCFVRRQSSCFQHAHLH